MTWAAKPTGTRGRQPVYSDTAIQTCLTMKVLFGMALRQTTGLVESLLHLIGLDWAVPDFSTLSRRQKTLAVNIPFRGSQGPLHLLIDSTGIKVEGEGEWNARKHGGAKRRVWRKIHIGIDEQTLEVRAVEVTSSEVGDAPMLPELLNQIPSDQEIASVTAPSHGLPRQTVAGQRTAPTTRASATMQLPNVVLPQSFLLAKTPSLGRPKAPVRLPATRRYVRRNTWAVRCGDDGVDTTAEAASKRRCTASNCWVSASWRGTSIVRSRSSRFVSPS